jgi:hypothetical protein
MQCMGTKVNNFHDHSRDFSYIETLQDAPRDISAEDREINCQIAIV